MKLSDKVTSIKGVGKANNEKLSKSGIHTVFDLINIYPIKYSDFTGAKSIKELRPGSVCFKAFFKNISSRRGKRGIHITEAIAYDEHSAVKVVWFNQSYRANSISIKEKYLISGNYELSNNRLQIINPSIEIENDSNILKSLIVPSYSKKYGLSDKLITKLIKNCFESDLEIPEILPGEIILKYQLMTRYSALKEIHLPSGKNMLDKSKYRLGFEEVYILMLASYFHKKQFNKIISPKIEFHLDSVNKFLNNLDFKLTTSQKKVLWQIYKDISSENPSNRLVEGDVGSGKTVIAAMAGMMSNIRKYKTALIAPTELLAQQHFETIRNFFKKTSLKDNIKLLTSKSKKLEKQDIINSLVSDEPVFIIGTHALLSSKIKWKNLGLLIIDEQHRFGVEQRQEIIKNSDTMPHILMLTATPIPRTLALTLYGELSISTLESRPSQHKNIKTEVVSPNSVDQMFNKIKDQLNYGRQIYIVCPVITEGLNSKLQSAESIYLRLKKSVFQNYKVGLLHGKMKSEDKEKIMKEYLDHKIDVLVSTTVIEVGIDVPNASSIIIYDANRFGLAQLHQLRGRVGRGQHKGYCYLVLSDSLNPPKRLNALSELNSGFDLAELDLKLRGPGAIYGTLQHGSLDLRLANINDITLLKVVRSAIYDNLKISDNVVKYKELNKKVISAGKLLFFN